MSSPQAAALLDHVVSQIHQNVQFLLSQNYISPSDASTIIARLPDSSTHSQPTPVPAPRLVPPPPARPVQARALWPFNEKSQESDDLSFSRGDIIEIISEVNEDWWMGKVHGKQALFPSNHVERIDAPDPTTPVSISTGARRLPPSVVQSGLSEKPVYRPFMAAHHGADAPPPADGGAVNSVGLQQAQGQSEKKGKFGKLGNTMANSAAGGVGFGAGAAIGGGLVRAIF